MLRIERVQRYVEDKCHLAIKEDEEPYVEISEVANALSIWPNDASVDLNKLADAGILKKVGKRPIKFYLENNTKESISKSINTNKTALNNPSLNVSDIFTNIIGYEGSLLMQIQMAKAAVSYPPYGLHTLIIGESGVGKSLLAESMWNFATHIKNTPNEPIPFVRFNCAEYADNPQLLISQLFGHVKGAFTGADEEKVGLIEMANRGILLLDEIHRLSSTNQELFFTLIDKGLYRRLGETCNRKADLMIIGTTTEDISNTLLTTFKRRIPVIISIPNLSERPMQEKYSLIMLFLAEESARLNLPISISKKTLELLLNYKSKGNIGDLRNTIQLCCAKSYLTYLSLNNSNDNCRIENLDKLYIDVYDFPQSIYNDVEYHKEYFSLDYIENEIIINPDDSRKICNFTYKNETSFDLYDFLEKQFEMAKVNGITSTKTESIISRKLEDYFTKSLQELNSNNFENSHVYNLIPDEIFNLSIDILNKAERELDRKYSNAIRTALALHLYHFVNRIKKGQIIYNPYLDTIRKRFPNEINVLEQMRMIMSEKLGIAVPIDEIGFIAIFLKQDVTEEYMPKIGVIIVTYGEQIATDMAEFANNIFDSKLVHPINKTNIKSLDEIYNELCLAIKTFDEGKGILILTDIDELITVENDLIYETNIQCKIMPQVNSILLLEACKIIYSNDSGIEDVCKQLANNYFNRFVSSYSNIIGTNSAYSCQNIIDNYNRKKVIITICSTGIGSATKMKDILLKKLPNSQNIEVMPKSVLDDIETTSEHFGSDLKLIIGTINPHIKGIPFINAEALFSIQGLSKINMLINEWGSNEKINHSNDNETFTRDELFELFDKKANLFSTILDKKRTITSIRKLIYDLEEKVYKKELATDIIGRIFMHTFSMLERLISGNALHITNDDYNDINNSREFFYYVKTLLKPLCEAFNVEIPDSEVYYFMLLLPELDTNSICNLM